MQTSKYFVFLLILISTIGCYEDFESTTIVTQEIEPNISYRHDISGLITDTSGTPLSGVVVTNSNISTVSDEDGSFSIRSTEIMDKGSFISFSLEEYISTGIRIYPQQSLTHDIDIQMVSDPPSYILSNDSGGSIETTDGLEIVIPAETILENDQIYAGQYEIQIFYINPKNTSNYNKQLRAYDVEVEELSRLPKIEALSMAYIKIKSPSNQELKIDPEKPLRLKFPTPHNSNSLPISSTLLSFDEEKGTWINEGTAQLNNSKYEASLNHLSWWTVANIRNTREFCFIASTDSTVSSEDNIYVVNTTSGNHVQAGRIEYGIDICFPAPIDEDLHMSIYNYCLLKLKEEIYPASPIDLNEVIEIKEITEGYNISVAITNCLANPLPGNYNIKYNNGNEIEINNDSFNIELGPCYDGSSLNIIIEDITTNSIHPLIVNIDSNINNYNESIALCSDIPEDQVLVFGDNIYQNCEAKVNPEEVIVFADDPIILIGFDYLDSGVTPCRVIHSTVSDIGTATIKNIGDIGEFITGTFQVNNTIDGSIVKGSFKALRKQ